MSFGAPRNEKEEDEFRLVRGSSSSLHPNRWLETTSEYHRPATTVPWTADEIEIMFHAALKAGDVQGVEAAIRVMVIADPHRAHDLWESLSVAVDFARAIRKEAER